MDETVTPANFLAILTLARSECGAGAAARFR
jgi:hypothetical protein